MKKFKIPTFLLFTFKFRYKVGIPNTLKINTIIFKFLLSYFFLVKNIKIKIYI